MSYIVKNKSIKFSIIVILVTLVICKVVYDMNVNTVTEVREDYEYTSETISLSVIVDQDNYVLQRNIEKYMNSNIEVYYPATKFEILNNEIKSMINTTVSNFKENVKDDIVYSLFINYDVYSYKDYISFVFHSNEDYAGAHPNTYIFTVNYNIKNNSIINIDTLINSNNNILNLISKYAYTNLANSKKMKEINMPNMLVNGTKPTKTNFRNFAYTQYGIIFFLERYQVAPYSYGEFCITIPYEQLNLNINE